MVTLMSAEQASAVARIHATVLSESIYTRLGMPFLDYYYRRLLGNDRYICHVHTFQGVVTGFVSSTSASDQVFARQIRNDAVPLGRALFRTVAANPAALAALASASRFLFLERRRLLPEIRGEILSFAVLPAYRTAELGPNGALRPTAFFAKERIAVATELFLSAARHLLTLGVQDVKIMTGAQNMGSNRFYAKMGCHVSPQACRVFGQPTRLYYGRLQEIVAPHAEPPVPCEVGAGDAGS